MPGDIVQALGDIIQGKITSETIEILAQKFELNTRDAEQKLVYHNELPLIETAQKSLEEINKKAETIAKDMITRTTIVKLVSV